MLNKLEGVRILFDVVDFPLGTLNNESISMPWWVSIVNAFSQSVHPWCQILLLTSWCDAICYTICHCAIGQIPSCYNGETTTIHNRNMSVEHWQEIYNEWSMNNFKFLQVFFSVQYWFVLLMFQWHYITYILIY